MNQKLRTDENYKPFTVKLIAYLKCICTVMSVLPDYMGSLWWLISVTWSQNVEGYLEFKSVLYK